MPGTSERLKHSVLFQGTLSASDRRAIPASELPRHMRNGQQGRSTDLLPSRQPRPVVCLHFRDMLDFYI